MVFRKSCHRTDNIFNLVSIFEKCHGFTWDLNLSGDFFTVARKLAHNKDKNVFRRMVYFISLWGET
jgi:hypothetical protein